MERSKSVSKRDWWSPSIYILVYFVGVWPTVIDVLNRWLKLDESYSHGLLIFAISVFIFIRKWLDTRPVIGFYWFWLIPFFMSTFVYLVGAFLLIEAVQQLALLPILMSGLMILWGWRQSCQFFVPVGLLVFGLPIWDYLAWPLQLITVAVNTYLLSFLDIEFFVDGVFVYFPGVGAFEIAHGCSGLRYLLTGLTIAVLYGEINYRTIRSRMLLVAAGTLLALMANWIRVLVIIYVGYESNMTSSLISNHEMFGWWVFSGTLIPLFFCAHLLERKESRLQLTENTNFTDLSRNPRQDSLRGGLAVILLALGFAISAWSASLGFQSPKTLDPVDHDVGLFLSDDWLPIFERQLAGWQPRVVNPDRRYVQSFISRIQNERSRLPAQKLLISLYSYDQQRPGGEVVQFGNRIYDPSIFTLEQTFSLDTDNSLTGISVKHRESGSIVDIVFGYYVEGRWEASKLQAKLAQLPGFLNKRTDASLLVLGIECSECDGKKRLAEFAPQFKNKIQTYLDHLYVSGLSYLKSSTD